MKHSHDPLVRPSPLSVERVSNLPLSPKAGDSLPRRSPPSRLVRTLRVRTKRSTILPMRPALSPADLAPALEPLRAANAAFNRRYPGESGARQPVHTVYGGAHLFRADSPRRLGDLALRSLRDYAPNFVTFAKALALRGADSLPDNHLAVDALNHQLTSNPAAARDISEPAWLAHTVYTRVLEKLAREPVEDFRIDFEDGYGARPDPEEDACAHSAAEQVAHALKSNTLPPFIGIRIKPFSHELHARGIRTLDLFLSALTRATGGALPPNFVVTLPKVVIPEQVSTLVDLFERLERRLNLTPGALRLELMIETTQSLIDAQGRATLPLLIDAARGRCAGAHFGVYDYTACCAITAQHQHMTHPACDFARHAMQISLAGTGVPISDGATNIMPVGPHRPEKDTPPLTPQQHAENRAVVHRAWRAHYNDVRHSLTHAYYQGWDLNPAQLPTRYAAIFSFFLEGLDAASDRLRNFIDKAAQATLVGNVFDDAATGQGLLNFFLRGLNCGAITEPEALRTGLTLPELALRSFVKILESRRNRPPH